MTRAADTCFVALDLEFTGLDPARDRIAEIGLVRFRGDVVEREDSTLIRSDRPMSAGAIAVTGITDSTLANAPLFAEIADTLRELLADAALVCHNVPTDIGFLQREFSRTGLPFPPPDVAIDTLLLCRRLFSFPKNNLAEVCTRLGIDVPGHRALADARATAAVLRRILAILDPDGSLALDDIVTLVDALAPNSPLRLRQQQVISDAWRHKRTVVIDYLSTTDPVAGAVRREVQVWAVRHPRFQGYCLLRGDERVFRLDRVTQVTPGDGTFDVPPDFRSRV